MTEKKVINDENCCSKVEKHAEKTEHQQDLHHEVDHCCGKGHEQHDHQQHCHKHSEHKH